MATGGARILVLNSWDDELAEYHRHIDHDRYRVGYVTVASALPRLDASAAAAIETVEAIEDGPALVEAAERVRRRLGGIDKVVALSEFDLAAGAALRRRFGVAGPGPDRIAAFTDKTVMKAAIRRAGLRVPPWSAADRPDAVGDLVERCGFPLVAKPKSGAASKGVEILSDADGLAAALARLPVGDYEVEAFVDGPILHVDGVMRGGRPMTLRASRYVGTCLGFAHGRPLGSITLAPSAEADRIARFATACLAALGLEDGAFHLELIDSPDHGLCFLEIGARLGGGEIPFLSKEVFGIDLLALWLAVELGDEPARVRPDEGTVGGFLMIPEPPERPCRVIERPSLVGRIGGLYAEVLPQPGDVLDGSGGYGRIGGRFRFRGGSEAEIRTAIDRTADAYRLVTERLPSAPAVEAVQ